MLTLRLRTLSLYRGLTLALMLYLSFVTRFYIFPFFVVRMIVPGTSAYRFHFINFLVNSPFND